jgi:plastocyanin
MLAAALGLFAVPAPNAHAIHLFPASPTGDDPLGHTCDNTKLSPPAVAPNATVHVDGFFFVDTASLTSSTTVPVGGTVSWQWDLWHCHSITISGLPLSSTQGAELFPGQPQLVRPDGSNNSWNVQFLVAGDYSYLCVHHASVGMTGIIHVV